MSNTQGYEFVNPYNFIPLGENRAAVSSEEEKNLTGVIEYSVLTKTPLFIPNTSNDDVFGMNKKPKNEQDKSCAEDHKSYDFFTYEDLSRKSGPAKNAMPVIPGSEIRGMFRSNFEILTNSCLSAVDNDVTMSKRTNEVFQAGLLKRNENGTFDLYAAEDCLMRTKGANSLEDDWASDAEHYSRRCYIQKTLPEGIKVYFNLVERGNHIKPLAHNVSLRPSKELSDEGYVIKGEDGPEMKVKNQTMKQQKHCCHIFKLKNGSAQKQNISLTTLDTVLKTYHDNKEHLYSNYKEQLELFRKGKLKSQEGKMQNYFPVYYSKIDYGSKNIQFMLSPAAITREIYNRKIKDMMSDFQPCNDKNNLCPACSLFGTVVQKGKDSFGVTSRIRFSDLTCDEESAEKCYMSKTTLAPLSSPKLNNMEFYLRRPASDAVFWTYDYYIDKKGTLFPNKCGINGRKFYWHNMSPDLTGCTPSNQNITVRPVKTKIQFHGKLYFQKLSATELNQLIYLLNAGEDDSIEIQDRTHGYKLGGAKPLGLGSIAVSVSQVMIRDVVKDSDKRCVERTEHPYEEYEQPKFDEKVVADFNKMTGFDSVKEDNVRYPRTDKVDENGNPVIYEWFVRNHVMKGKDGTYNPNGMPTSRKEMAYAKYMEPMNSDLVSTEGEGNKRFSKPCQPKKEMNTGGASIQPKKEVHTDGELKKGELYQAEVVACNQWGDIIQIGDRRYPLLRKNMSKVTRENGDKGMAAVGDKIIVRCISLDNDGSHPEFQQRAN